MSKNGETTKKTGIYGYKTKSGNMRLSNRGKNFLEEKFRKASIKDLLYANPRTNRLFRILLGRGHSSEEVKEFLHYEFCLAAMKWDGKTSSWNTFVTNGLYYGLLRMYRRPNDVKINNKEIDKIIYKQSRKNRMENQEKEVLEPLLNEDKHKFLTELNKRISIILNEKEREILTMKCHGKSYHEIGVKFGISKERVRQLYIRSLEKIREFYLKKDDELPEYEF